MRKHRRSLGKRNHIAAIIEKMEHRQLLSATLTGTIIGTPGSYNKLGNTISKVFDGNLSNYFDAPVASGAYAGLDFGSAKVVNQISYAPRQGYASRMVGGSFEGSNYADFSHTTTLFTITSAPAKGKFTTVDFDNAIAYRYVRYVGPANSYCDVSELQFAKSSPAPGVTLLPNGTLSIGGTGAADNIEVQFNLFLDHVDASIGSFDVNFNGVATSYPSSSVKQLSIVLAGPGHNSFYNGEVEDGVDGIVDGQAIVLPSNEGQILGRAYIDANHNGTFNPGDTALGGRTVYLDLNNDGVLDAGDISSTTDSTGHYAFSGLTPDIDNGTTYSVNIVAPAGYALSNGTTIQSVALTTGTAKSGIDFALVPAVGKLTGTVIGTAGSYQNKGNTESKAFDGILTNYFDGPDASGDWVGLDLGSAKVATQVKFAPRVGFESRMVGGKIQASNTADFSSGVTTLLTISTAPKSGAFTVASVNNSAAYRYYRYIGATNSSCNIAELEFDG